MTGRLVGGLLTLIFAITLGTVMTARAMTNTNPLRQHFGFDVCEGRPCFFGVQPGVTTWNEARTLLQLYGQGQTEELDTPTTNRITLKYQDGSTVVWFESDRRKQHVRRIIWVTQEKQCCPALADLLAVYNEACGDWRTEMATRGSSVLRYLSAHTRRTTKLQSSPLYIKVYSIVLSNDLSLACRR